MRRREYRAVLLVDGAPVASATRYAWNAAVRASESLMRDYARDAGGMYAGDPPCVVPVDDTTRRYAREWWPYGGRLIGEVRTVPVVAVVTGPRD